MFTRLLFLLFRFNCRGMQSIVAMCIVAFLFSVQAQTLREAPRIIQQSADHGPAMRDDPMVVTIHLKLRDQDGFDKRIEGLYDAGSANYHRWMSPAEIASYGTAPEQLAAVKKELESHGLTVLEVDGANSSIRARGIVSQIEDAFQTRIHEFVKNGVTFNSNITPPSLTGPAGNSISAVSGLSSLRVGPFGSTAMGRVRVNANPGMKTPAATTQSGIPSSVSNKCFGPPATITLTGNNLVATYQGTTYIPQPRDLNPNSILCAWTPQQLQDHYGLRHAYEAGYEGQGQTVVIVSTPTHGDVMTQDLNYFSSSTGLPAITNANFRIIYPDGVPTPAEFQLFPLPPDFTFENIEWVHALAPKAHIALLIMPTWDWSELEYGIQYAVRARLGNVISVSYSSPEEYWSPADVNGFERILENAAAMGVTVNFPSGDVQGGLGGRPTTGSAFYPATSAWATAIGGTSIGIPKADGTFAEVGWGKDFVQLSQEGNPFTGVAGHFLQGSGGGESTLIVKPLWQNVLPGRYRQAPDIAAVADSETGPLVYGSEFFGGTAEFFGGGGDATGGGEGTGLATSIFSAIWTLATQKAGQPLGQAARIFGTLPKYAIGDIVPVSNPNNVTGSQVSPSGTVVLTAEDLAYGAYQSQGVPAPLAFVSVLENGTEGYYNVSSFETNHGQQVVEGWDNVTGWGVPNGYKFISAAAAASHRRSRADQ